MNKTNFVIFFLLVLIGGLGLAIYFQNRPVTEQIPLDVQPTLPVEPIKKPIVHYPVPDTTPQPAEQPEKPGEGKTPSVESQSLGSLSEPQINNTNFQTALTNSLDSQTASKLLLMENFIQKFVVTIDNLPNKRLPRAHLPIKAPGGKFLVAGTPEAPQISSKNYQRYNKYVTLVELINPDSAVKFYTYFYPLFQTAYEQLGYKNAYFNDRLVYVINHLLEMPNPPDPILLAQPAILFTYVDPNLENLSSGQKMLLRLGQEQRMKVHRILQKYRDKLINLQP